MQRARTRPGSPAEVFLVFLWLGLTSFGGPVAHLGYFRQEFVTRRNWLSDQQFAELVALCQFLPGPASSQVGFAIGLGRAGYRGALAAWAAFTLPSAVLMVLVASGAAFFTGTFGTAVLFALQVVAIAVISYAVWRMARRLTPDFGRALIAIVAAAVVLLWPGTLGQIVAIAFGVCAGLLFCRDSVATKGEDRPLRSLVSPRVAYACLGVLATLLAVLPLLAAALPFSLFALADAFTRAGALVFGGGHVVLPLLQAEPAIASAVTPEQFLAGYGAAQAMPGPLFSFAAYLGAVAQPGGGVFAALVALISVFLPGLLLLVGVWPFWSRIRSARGAQSAIRGVNAAVVGVLTAALLHAIFALITTLIGWW